MTAKDIERVLATRHSGDVFIPQCKTGPTQTGPGFQIMDAWAMKKSWTKRCVICYEIKVDRGDFLNDQKWQGYLDYCNEFYFVCPWGLIAPNELPREVGLIYVTKNGKKTLRKKASVYRDIAIPEDVFRYILYSRTRVLSKEERHSGWEEDSVEIIEQALREKDISRLEGRLRGKRIRELIQTRINEVEQENRDVKNRLQVVKDVIAAIKEETGVDLNSVGQYGGWSTIREIKAIITGKDLRDSAKSLIKELNEFCQELDKHSEKTLNTPGSPTTELGDDTEGTRSLDDTERAA